MRKIKLKRRETKQGFWDYINEPLCDISVKKGETTFIGSQEIFEPLDCVKINGMIYDIVSCEDNIVTISEPFQDDYEGIALYSASLPIKVRRSTEVFEMCADAEAFKPKPKAKEVILARCSKEVKMEYMALMEELGKIDIDPNNITITKIDELENKIAFAKASVISELVQLVINIDMDYEYEEGKTLWNMFNVPQGNYYAVAVTLKNQGILADKEDIEKLKNTIEAIKLDKDVDKFLVEKSFDELQIQANFAYQHIRNQFATEQEFQDFLKLFDKKGALTTQVEKVEEIKEKKPRGKKNEATEL